MANSIEVNKHYIIAELANAHGGQLDVCLTALEGASSARADAFKVATYKPEDLTVKSTLEAFSLKNTLWKAFEDFYGLYDKIHMPWDFHAPLFARGQELGIDVFSSPFSPTAVEYLKTNFDPVAYKIASFEIVDDALVSASASQGKPIIISTGQANYDDIERALMTAEKAGCHDIHLLHCISKYPAVLSDVNLASFVALQKRFGGRAKIGLSDHTTTITAPLLVLSMGGSMLEKHITVSKDEYFANGIPNPDVKFSLTPDQFKTMVEAIRSYEELLDGKVFADFDEAVAHVREFIKNNSQYQYMVEDNIDDMSDAWGEDTFNRADDDFKSGYRRSLIVTKPIAAGDTFVLGENYAALRPGHGAHPKMTSLFEGSAASRALQVGEGLDEIFIQDNKSLGTKHPQKVLG